MPTTDIFGLRSPAGADAGDVPTKMSDLTADVEAALAGIVGRWRTIHESTIYLDSGIGAATAARHAGTGNPVYAGVHGVVNNPLERFRLSKADLDILAGAGLKPQLRLACNAMSANTDPNNGGKITAYLQRWTPVTGVWGATSWADVGGTKSLGIAVPDLAPNDDQSFESTAYDVLVTNDLSATPYTLGVVTTTGAPVATGAVVLLHTELQLRYLDRD